MAKQNKKTLKGYFETGDVPNQTQYQHLIDSQLNLSETGTQILVGTLSSSFLEVENHITSSGNISSSGNFIVNEITSSGNISASGNITADTLISNNIIFTSGSTSIRIEAPDEPSGNVTGADLIFEAGSAFGSNFKGGNITLQAGKGSGAGDGGDITINTGAGVPSGSVNINGNVSVIQHITASGNVSASGVILANQGNFNYLLTGVEIGKDQVSGINSDGILNIAASSLAYKSMISFKGANIQQWAIGVPSISAGDNDFVIQEGTNTSLNASNAFIITKDNQNVGINYQAGTDLPSKLSVKGDITTTTHITASGNLKVDGSQVDFTNLPTSDPGVSGRLYNDSGTIKISL